MRFKVTLSVMMMSFMLTGVRFTAAEDLQLTVYLELNPKVYNHTVYGDPPQLAIWLEHLETGELKSLFVTYRAATGNWRGKFECPVALPYWVSRYKKGAGKNGYPSSQSPLPDGISGATPQKKLSVNSRLKRGSEWRLFIEVNASGDYNGHFPANSVSGVPDTQGNGQPSIVYSGKVLMIQGEQPVPGLIGRTLQRRFTDTLVTDVNTITSAKTLLSTIRVTVSN